jgi:hypothetical protein
MLKKLIFPAILLILLAATSCKKSSDETTPGTVTGDDVTTTNLVVSPNVYIIKDADMQYDPWSSDPAAGIYRYSCPGTVPQINAGAVVVDTLEGGYIRKVTESTTQGNYLTLKTTQALLSDIFQEGELSFRLDPNGSPLKSSQGKLISYRLVEENLEQGVTSPNNIDYNFNSSVAADVNLSGSFHTQPVIKFDFVFSKEKGIQKFTCSLDQTQLILQATAALNITGSAKYSIEKSFGTVTKRAMFWVYGVPVVMDIEMILSAMGYVSFEEEANFPITYTNTTTLGYGVTYENKEYTFTKGFSNKSVLSGSPSYTAKGQLEVEVVPQITIQFYKVLSTVIKPKPYLQFMAQYTNSGDTTQVCAEVSAGINLGLGINAAVFGDTLFDISKDFEVANTVLWKSLEGCEIPKVHIANPGTSYGSHYCEDLFIPYTVTFDVDDPGHLIGPGTILHSIYAFHVPGGYGNTGAISRTWDQLTFNGNRLSYNICIHWEEADYVEQNIYLELPGGTQTNVISMIIGGGKMKMKGMATGLPGIY